MNAIDFSPLMRTAIGFDRFARLLDGARAQPDTASYPPYNIEVVGEDQYVLTMAVAGFAPEDIEIMVREDTLLVSGKAGDAQAEPGRERRFIHRGIAGRAFERRFVLADHLVVHGAQMEHGLLHIALKREMPEALKPRRIAIQAGRPVIEQSA